VFGLYANLLIFEKDTFKKGLFYLRKYIQLNRNVLPRPPQEPTKSIVDKFREFISTQYINGQTKEEILDALIPFIGTYSKRRAFDINMCLSVVFSGAPGDGKTYTATQIVRWISRRLDLKSVSEEANIFKEAAKLAPDFVGLIDDMNVSHFQREGNGGICQNILSEMDRPNCNRLFLLTTNEIVNKANVDSAFFRPGRIQNIIQFDKPDRYVKESIIDNLVSKLKRESISLDREFVAGVKIFTEDQDLSLAEMMRLTNLVITDIIMETKLADPRTYIKNAKSVQPEESYNEIVST
jgi:SpoVK/Ycf46/Vps4 family AAA+-type ATPase